MSGAEEIVERVAHRLPPGETIANGIYERWRKTPNRDAYVAAMMLEAGRLAYEAGRQDAAGKDTETEKQFREWMLAFAAILWQQGGTLVLGDPDAAKLREDLRERAVRERVDPQAMRASLRGAGCRTRVCAGQERAGTAMSERPPSLIEHALAGDRAAFRAAIEALVKTRDQGPYDPDDRRIPDALECDDWCLECVGPDAAATVAAKIVAEVLWPLAVQAGREAAARDIESTVVAGQKVPEWAFPGGTPTAEGLRTWAAAIARGDE